MAIPEQIRKQSEDVQKLYAQMSGDNQDQDEDDESKTEKVNAEDKGVDKSDSAQDDSTSNVVSEHDDDDDDALYAQKYRTLQGMYNSQVPQLKAEKDQLNNRVSQLESVLASLKDSTIPTNTPNNDAQVAEKLVSQEDIDEYGESIDIMRKVSREEIGALNSTVKRLERLVGDLSSSLNNSIVPQVQSVAQQHKRNTSENFWSKLQTLVPDWQKVNSDQDFHTWLLTIDPLTGTSRQQHLEEAQESFNADRVAAFFTAYTAGNGDKAIGTNAQSNRSASELRKQIAPGRSRNDSAITSSEPAKYTNSEIADFYSDVQKGRYRGKEQERDRIERDIYAAQREGRLVPN